MINDILYNLHMARDKSAPFLALEFTATRNESMVKLKGN